VNVILNLASQADRRLAAIATTNGAALFYGFGNFCALAAMPDLASVQRVNALKGRPLAQPGSVTTDPSSRPSARSARDNNACSSPVSSTGGFGGSGAGRKAR